MAMYGRRTDRRGVSTGQLVLLLSVLVLTIVATLRTLGTRVSTNLTTTSGNVANPSTLPSRFGS